MSVYSGPNTAQSGLVLHIDASNPRCYPGSGSTLFDLSGQGNNGTLTNGATVVTNGAGRALNFSTGVNDSLQLTFNSELFKTSTNNFTVSAWIYVRSFANGFSFSIFSSGSTDYQTMSFAIYYYKLTLIASTSGQNWEIGLSGIGSTQLSTGVWYYAVITRSQGGAYTAYVNGRRDGALTNASNILIGNNTFRIGGHYGGSTVDDANGLIDDVRILNSALSPAEIAQNYHATRGRYGL